MSSAARPRTIATWPTSAGTAPNPRGNANQPSRPDAGTSFSTEQWSPQKRSVAVVARCVWTATRTDLEGSADEDASARGPKRPRAQGCPDGLHRPAGGARLRTAGVRETGGPCRGEQDTLYRRWAPDPDSCSTPLWRPRTRPSPSRTRARSNPSSGAVPARAGHARGRRRRGRRPARGLRRGGDEDRRVTTSGAETRTSRQGDDVTWWAFAFVR